MSNNIINSFKGKYAFLSNYYEVPVQYEGLTYKNSEAAFQAAKTLNTAERKEFTDLTPNNAKAKGRSINLRADWEKVKLDIMYDINMAKFTQNSDLREKLIATGDAYLEEGNTWNDRYWGTVNGVGQNQLGKVLMRVREDLQSCS